MTAAAPAETTAATPATTTGAQPTPSAPTKSDDSLIPAPAKPAAAAPVTLPEKDGYNWPEWVPEIFRREKVDDPALRTSRDGRELLNDKGEPEWEKIAEKAATSHKELLTKLGEKQKYLGAPKDPKTGEPVAYEFKAPEGLEPIEAEAFQESSLWKGFQAKASEMNLNQEAVNELVGAYLMDAARENAGARERELTRLRFLGWSNERLSKVGEFYAAKLTPEMFEAWRGFAKDADFVLLSDALMNTMLSTTTLPKDEGTPAQTDPLEPWKQRMKDPRNHQDPEFAKGTTELLQRILTEHPEAANAYR